MESSDKSEKNSIGPVEASNNESIDKAEEESTRTVENSIKHQHHSIIQTDETITVIVNESYVNGKNGEVSPTTSTGDASSSTAEAKCDEKKQRKKSVKFESDENIKKFIDGEEIVDQENPFKDEIDSRRFIIKKKSKSPSGDGSTKNSKTKIVSINGSNGSANKNESSDFVTKEEVLRQSKYVPVYIKNPDSVLTYDRTVLEAIAKRDKTKPQKSKQQQRGPVPMPRKSLMSNGKKVEEKKKSTTTTHEKKSASVSRSRKLTNYPDLADLKVSNIISLSV